MFKTPKANIHHPKIGGVRNIYLIIVLDIKFTIHITDNRNLNIYVWKG